MSEPAVTKCLQEFQKALLKLEIDINKIYYIKASNSILIAFTFGQERKETGQWGRGTNAFKQRFGKEKND